MGEFGVRKNASGYYDDTCYKGITTGPQPGEIYVSARTGDYRLIIANNGALCNCLKLYEGCQEGEIRVLCRVPMYVNPLKVSYAHTPELTQFIKSIPESEFKVIHRAVIRALGAPGKE